MLWGEGCRIRCCRRQFRTYWTRVCISEIPVPPLKDRKKWEQLPCIWYYFPKYGNTIQPSFKIVDHIIIHRQRNWIFARKVLNLDNTHLIQACSEDVFFMSNVFDKPTCFQRSTTKERYYIQSITKGTWIYLKIAPMLRWKVATQHINIVF